MKPNSEDPNNHVPPIAPGDDWSDLDDSTARSRIGLPPRRAEGRLPPKKESPEEEVGIRTGIKAKGAEKGIDEIDTVAEEGDEPSPPEDESESRRKVTGKVRREPVRKFQPKQRKADAEEVEIQKDSREAVVVLPNPIEGKRVQVNEIGPGNHRPATRGARAAGIVAKTPSAEPDSEPKDVVEKRRRSMRGERSDWGDNQRIGSLKWMLLTGIGVACLVVFAVAVSQRPKGGKAREREQSHYSKMEPADDGMADPAKEPDDVDQLIGSRGEAESIFSTYARAESASDFIALVHDPDRNRELIESEWKSPGMEAGWEPGSESVWYVKEGDKSRYAVLEGVFTDFTGFRAFFREDGEKLRMDWKATTGYGTADFGDLKAGKGDGSSVRVWLAPADFYTFSFPEGEYRSFRIMSPDAKATIWGYVPAGGDLEERLMKLFRPSDITGESQGEIQMILRLAASGGDSLPGQWLIADILRLDWLDE